MVIYFLWTTIELPLSSLWLSDANRLHWIMNVHRSPIEICVNSEWIRYDLRFYDDWASIEFQMNCYRLVLPAKSYDKIHYGAGLIENPISCHSKSWICTESNLESRIRNQEPRILNPQSDPESRIQNPESGTGNPESRIQNPALGIQNSENEMWNPASITCNPESGIRNPETGIQNPATVIWNPESGISNPESRIWNPESRIPPESGIQNQEARVWSPDSGTRNPEL